MLLLLLAGCSSPPPTGPDALVDELRVLHAEVWGAVQAGGTGRYRAHDVRFGPALHTAGSSAHTGMIQISPAGTPARPGVYSVGISPDQTRLGISATDGVSCVYLAADEGVAQDPVLGRADQECLATMLDPALDAVGDGWALDHEIDGTSLTVRWRRVQGALFHRLVCAAGTQDVVVESHEPSATSLSLEIPGPGSWLCQLEAYPRAGATTSSPLPLLIY
jgi:hypothetical protein